MKTIPEEVYNHVYYSSGGDACGPSAYHPIWLIYLEQRILTRGVRAYRICKPGYRKEYVSLGSLPISQVNDWILQG